MTTHDRPQPGTVAWFDLTVPDAALVRDFYAAVVGWVPQPVVMDGYDDYAMAVAPGGPPVGGICHARGPNADLPPQWLAYIVVADLDASLRRCLDLGGQLVAGPNGDDPGSRYAVIRDPAGAVAALIEQQPDGGG